MAAFNRWVVAAIHPVYVQFVFNDRRTAANIVFVPRPLEDFVILEDRLTLNDIRDEVIYELHLTAEQVRRLCEGGLRTLDGLD